MGEHLQTEPSRNRADAGEPLQLIPGSVPSPCVSVCRLTDDRRYCLGCFRSLDEIRAWKNLDDHGKKAVWQHIAERSEGRLKWP
ncbi:DUF1289 domain-containing protein [Comamonadaceae bacterium OH2545_COT-014]|nr:DUF1289 domain-containing protein [Comamonadaceae bacterium OH2545_COT-014]